LKDNEPFDLSNISLLTDQLIGKEDYNDHVTHASSPYLKFLLIFDEIGMGRKPSFAEDHEKAALQIQGICLLIVKAC
jgi:hypothetical protein